jgi:hypothetical protein
MLEADDQAIARYNAEQGIKGPTATNVHAV